LPGWWRYSGSRSDSAGKFSNASAGGPLKDEDIEHLDVNLKRIAADWQSRGAIDEQDILNLFSDAQVARVKQMFEFWYRLSKPDKTGELDVAIEKKDGAKILQLLGSILSINQEFLEMAADRFTGMISREAPQSATGAAPPASGGV
jgi:hypothetical protein